MKVAKLYFPNEIRRVCVCDKTFDDIFSIVSESIRGSFDLAYLDNERDFVTFSSQEEWEEALQHHAESVLRIYVQVKQPLMQQQLDSCLLPRSSLWNLVAAPTSA